MFCLQCLSPRPIFFPKYDPVVIPIQVNNTCLKLKLPGRIYEKEGEFFTAEASDCEKRPSGLLVCLDDFALETDALKVNCLNDNRDCEFETVRCRPAIKQLRAGAFIFARGPVLALTVNETNKLTRVDPGELGSTKLYPWSAYTMLQANNRIVYSLQPEDEVEPIMWKSLNLDKWHNAVRERVVVIKSHNVSILLQKSRIAEVELQKLADNLKEVVVASDSAFSRVADWCAFLSIGLWAVTAAVLFYRKKRGAKSNHNSKKSELSAIKESLLEQQSQSDESMFALNHNVHKVARRLENIQVQQAAWSAVQTMTMGPLQVSSPRPETPPPVECIEMLPISKPKRKVVKK